MELRCVSSPAISLLPSTSSSCSTSASRIAFALKSKRSGSSSKGCMKFRLGGVVRASTEGGDRIGADAGTAMETPAPAFIPAAIDVPVVPAAAPVAVPAAAPVTMTAAPGASNAGGAPAAAVATTAATGTTTTTINATSFETEFPAWERIGAVIRLCYGVGIYGAMALAGKFICSVAGIDCAGGFQPTLEAIVDGLGYAAPPIMALLFILDDEVVKYSPHARAIRDVEDEELRSFFYGMSVWQFVLVVTASSVGEELFYRAAVQGALANLFLRSTELAKDAHGLASLTGLLPPFVPFAQAFAAVITAALTGSLYYAATTPKDPTYVVAPVLKPNSGREELKKLFAAWYQRRQMKKIYSPLLEGLLALYLGVEWIQTDNILAPMITHGIYSAVVLGHGLLKIHDHRRKLRHRVQQIKLEGKN